MSKSQKIYLYLKKDSDEAIIERIMNIIPSKMSVEMYTDAGRDYIMYNQIKELLLVNKGLLVICSLSDIGDTKSDIYSELVWFKSNKIPLVVADYPATHYFDNTQANMIALDVLSDVYKSLQEYKNFEIGYTTNTAGRKKIKFPENWSDLYDKWQSGEITAKQFMESTGLKKGTFYHLINDYKELLKINQSNISKIG